MKKIKSEILIEKSLKNSKESYYMFISKNSVCLLNYPDSGPVLLLVNQSVRMPRRFIFMIFKKNGFSQKECEIFFNIERVWSLFLVNRAFFNVQRNAHLFFHNEWYWKSTLVLKCNFMKHFMVLVIQSSRRWLMFKN